MIEVKHEEPEPLPEVKSEVEPEPEPTPEMAEPSEVVEDQQSKPNNEEEATLNPLNDSESHADTESKGKNRRYWTPKEEDKFFLIWGRENWRLTKHGKNTIFFAKWADEMKERFSIDVKPEEVQCKVNQTRAKYRQVKRLLETDRNAIKWKKFDLVEKILRNQYRSKDDEPVPQEAMENNRDMSPTELLNHSGAPTSPANVSNTDEGINLNQSTGEQQVTEDVSLSEQNLTTNVYSNNSQSNTSFSTELFGLDQMEIKQEIEADIKREGFSEFLPNEHAMEVEPTAAAVDVEAQLTQISSKQASEETSTTTEIQNPNPPSTPVSQVPSEVTNNDVNQLENNQSVPINNSHTVLPNSQNHTPLVETTTTNNNGPDNMAVAIPNHVNNNHTTKTPAPRRRPSSSTTPRKRNRTQSATASAAAAAKAAKALPPPPPPAPLTQETLETMFIQEIKKKNVILVEQGEISRKRLKLEEKKVKLMEEFFPKLLKLQQDILKKLDNVTVNASTPESINIRIEE
ncbi:myb-like protein X [Stomoxys calcitrans]|uniref:myb-like protein X n=1 Tax=Stomoxys calcitrans TaxID=35570 RepID=UPI0027E3A6E5|nr:myb-like protein X [Stomoxys calcitrans]